MKNAVAILALFAVLPAGIALADDEPVDCFYESNAGNALCQKNGAPDRLNKPGTAAVDATKPVGNDAKPAPTGVAAVHQKVSKQ